jgi:hypothetical protein
MHRVKRCLPARFRVTFRLAVAAIRCFLVGKPDFLGFTGETATHQPSTRAGTLSMRHARDLLHLLYFSKVAQDDMMETIV